ncbi:MAG: hypothetical protein ACM30D_18150 [Hyphomicrobiales bacterium]|jgi:hypothetical protein
MMARPYRAASAKGTGLTLVTDLHVRRPSGMLEHRGTTPPGRWGIVLRVTTCQITIGLTAADNVD